MKKIVSLALSTAMALSMFASVTSAATLSTQEKYNALVTQGIFEGYPDGNSYLDKDMTRAEFAKVVALLTGLDTAATGTNTYQDQNYANAWYKPYVEAVTKAGYMQGTTTGAKKLFNPNGKVTVQEMAATLVRAAKLEVPTTGINNSASAWAKGEVQAAINAGLISNTSNFTAAATRGLLVDTAYAFQTAVNKPAVTSYEVQDNGATVIFTLANGEKVTVKPEKALVANTATTVNFKYGEFEYSESVTWTVTDATKVVSAAASNLKEVTVTFDGKVDPASATNTSNYTVAGRSIKSVSLSEDGRVATILLAQDQTSGMVDTLTNNRETTLTVRNIKPATGTATITQTLTFTPSDVTVPTVTEVKGLGTRAFQVTFSEPVQSNSLTASQFQVDGKAIAATVTYSYPNTAIVETSLTEGSHTLRVSGVRDYSGLTIVPTEQTFTVTADTTAPKAVSATSNDLNEVVVTFDEPVKSVGSAYANVSNYTATTPIAAGGTQVTLKFPTNLNYGENTIVLNNVRDYNGNIGSATVKVTPTLDLVAPTVSSVEFYQSGSNFFAEINLSKAVTAESARNLENYTLKNSAGNVVTGNGRNSAGHPTTTPTISDNNKKVTVNLGTSLTDNYYTLTVSGLRDNTLTGNVLLPYTATLDRTATTTGRLVRSWSQNGYVFIEYSKPVAVTGTGSAIDPAKYTLASNVAGTTAVAGTDGTARLTTSSNDIETYGANTVRIYARNFVNNQAALSGNFVVASYIADGDGNYFTNGTSNYTLTSQISSSTSRPQVVATNNELSVTGNELAVTFSAPLSQVRASDFTITNGSTVYTATAASLSNDNRTVDLTFGNGIPANLGTGFTLAIAATGGTTDQFGNTATTATPITIVNSIRPSATGDLRVVSQTTTGTTRSVVVRVDVNQTLTAVQPGASNAFTVSTNNTVGARVTGVTQAANADGVANRALDITVALDSLATTTVTLNLNGTTVDQLDLIQSGSGSLNGFEKSVNVAANATTGISSGALTANISTPQTITFNQALDQDSQDDVVSALQAGLDPAATGSSVSFNSAGTIVTITPGSAPTNFATGTPVVVPVRGEASPAGQFVNVTLVDIP